MRILREIAFINSDISASEYFVAGLRSEVEPVVLDRNRPGLEQIAQALTARKGLAAIHIVAHGAPGEIRLGSSRLTPAAVKGRSAEIAQIGHALGAGGKILLWSCETSAGAEGRRLVLALSEAAGVPVAASPHVIGAAPLGGRWELDGADPTQAPLTAEAASAYAGVLALTAAKLTKITNDFRRRWRLRHQ